MHMHQTPFPRAWPWFFEWKEVDFGCRDFLWFFTKTPIFFFFPKASLSSVQQIHLSLTKHLFGKAKLILGSLSTENILFCFGVLQWIKKHLWLITEQPKAIFSIFFLQILHHSKLKEFADHKFKFDENCWKFSILAENTGKRRNCSYRAISPFPTVFSKDLYCRHCLGKG